MSLVGAPGRRLSEGGRLWLQSMVIAAVVAGGAYLGPRAASGELTAAASRTALLAAVAVLGMAAVLAFPRWPPLGFVALVGGILTIPFTVDTGTQTSLNVAVLLLGVLVALWPLEMAGKHRAELAPSWVILPLLVLIAVAIVAFLAGIEPWLYYVQTAPLPAQVGGLAIWVLSTAAFLLMGHQVRDLRWLQVITWLFLALGALHVAAYYVPGAGELSRALRGRTVLGSLFWTWLAALAFSQAAFNRSLGALWRLALGALLLAAFYVGLIVQRDWTSGWLPPLVAVAVAMFAGAPRLTPALALAGMVGTLAKAPTLYAFAMGGDNQYSLMTRLEAWRTLAEIIGINPVFGLGFANYYWYTPYFPIVSINAFGTAEAYAVRFNSHNNYVDIIAQTGLVGLACFLWFACAVGVLGWRLRTRARPGFARAYVYGALGGLAGMLVAGMLGDWVLPFVYNIGFSGFRYSVLGWIFLGGLVVVERSTRQAVLGNGEPDGAGN